MIKPNLASSKARNAYIDAMLNVVNVTEDNFALAEPSWEDRYDTVLSFFESNMGLQKPEMLPKFSENKKILDWQMAICLAPDEWERFVDAYDKRRRFDRFFVGVGRRRAAHRRKK